jgi:hypothetical protein
LTGQPPPELVVLVVTAACGFMSRRAVAQTDPLPSWNDGPVKKSIVDFVARVTTQGGADFVPPAARVLASLQDAGTSKH